ncbi:DEAD/DEAH box helicase family protein [Deinococcus malanensis]|uniref:DEAD/DEAH box helicase family protein n=1 Tax=Deinococcus malanensis TaxID=1706855 RepID=UPI003626CB7D
MTLVAPADVPTPARPSLLQAILDAADTPGTTVISAVPGAGKTHAAFEVIAERFLQRRLQRVLIAVSSTAGAGSLAAQVQRDLTELFQALGLTQGVKIIYGRAAVQASTPAGEDAAQRYAAQFRVCGHRRVS